MEEAERWSENVAELYGSGVVYERETRPFARFARDCSDLSNEELERRLEDIRGYRKGTPHEAIALQVELASKRRGVQLVKMHGVQLANATYEDLRGLEIDDLISIMSTVAVGNVRTINLDSYPTQIR